MNLYRQLSVAHQQLNTRQPRPGWHRDLGDLDDIVAAIRDDHPDPAASDTVLRRLLTVSRREPDALTVVLYALAPRLLARIGRAVTDEYRSDALADLAFVLLDSPLDRAGLAHRLVNRAHNRTYKAAVRTHQRGVVHPVTITPQDPDRLLRRHETAGPDMVDTVVRRIDLTRFHAAVQDALTTGTLSPAAWAAYRDHRLRRAVDPAAPVCNGTQRTTALRAAGQLQPLIDIYLHAA